MTAITLNRLEKAKELYRTQVKRKHYERLEATLIDELKYLCKGRDFSEAGYSFNRIERKGAVDYGMIPELESVDLEQYRKETIEYWKLSKV